MDWRELGSDKTPIASFPPGSSQLFNYGAADGYPSAQGLVPASAVAFGPRPQNFHSMSLGILIGLPVLLFNCISLCIALLFQALPGFCGGLTACGLALSLLFLLAPQKGDRPRYWFNLGFLCLIAVVAANLIGLLNFQRHFALFWAYEGQRDYTNVQPAELALTHLDAGKLYFSQETHVDTRAAVGITDGRSRFCVAPIVGDKRPEVVEYWAAGMDCCDNTGLFTCDEVGAKEARAGLVYLDYGPFQDQLALFRKAAREAGGRTA